MNDRLDVVVLHGAIWAELETAALRWRFVAPRLLSLGLAERVTVVDFPHFRRRAMLDPRFPLVRELGRDATGFRVLDATVPGGDRPRPVDRVGWARVGRAIAAALGPAAGRRIAISASPLWVPVLAHLDVDRRGFDAEDDWRCYDGVAHLAGRVGDGYRRAAGLDAVTANSGELVARLWADFGLAVTHVGNGVDRGAFAHPGPPPAGLPDRPFAVYVGTIQSRVDLGMLEAAARRLGAELPVVLAGPAGPEFTARLDAGPWTWLGPVPHEQVPGLLAAAAVGLLPHRRNAFTDSMEPLKLLEYLAAGLPVVASRVAGVNGWGPAVTVVDSGTEMADAVRAAAQAPPDPARSRQLVADRDWDDVTRRLLARHAGG
ncbi:MAG TPA: glycosyltransferase [Mycobacteriales bacterium]|nr:glycosyltransferase [Mycobacteriales bacterium]